MNADDLAVQLYAELRKHPHDAREFIRGMLEQMSTAELTDLVASNEDLAESEKREKFYASLRCDTACGPCDAA